MDRTQAGRVAPAAGGVEADLAVAMRCHALGDATGAEGACVAALRKPPRHSTALMMLAVLALDRRDWDRASARREVVAIIAPPLGIQKSLSGQVRSRPAVRLYSTAARGIAVAGCGADTASENPQRGEDALIRSPECAMFNAILVWWIRNSFHNTSAVIASEAKQSRATHDRMR
jgi:hypothetical protein